jgi:plastocyanin
MLVTARADGAVSILAAALVVLAGTAPAMATPGTAGVEGRVDLPAATAAPATAARYPFATSHEVGTPDQPAAIVYLEGDLPPPAPVRAEVGQERYQFAPGLLAVPRGSTVAFPNRDDEYHSVFSYSKPKRFDLGRYRRDEKSPALVFDEAGVVRLYCEIHDHMRGTILVLDTAHATRTDEAGRYRLTGLPAGTFTLVAWVDEDTVRRRGVTLHAGETLRVDFPKE